MTASTTHHTRSPGAARTAATTTAKSSTLDQAAFLKLMTTQLKTQDPFDPVDNTQMVAQMAQFSSVAGISEMNTSLKAIATDIAGSRVGDAASWIGRSALVAVRYRDAARRRQLCRRDHAAGRRDQRRRQPRRCQRRGRPRDRARRAGGRHGRLRVGRQGGGRQHRRRAARSRCVVTAANADGRVTATTSTWTGISAVQSPAGGATKLVTPLGLIAPADAQRLG